MISWDSVDVGKRFYIEPSVDSVCIFLAYYRGEIYFITPWGGLSHLVPDGQRIVFIGE